MRLTMVKNTWDFSRVIILLFGLIGCIFWTVNAIRGLMEHVVWTTTVYRIFFATLFGVIFYTRARTFCMRVVRKYIRVKDLKQMLEKEPLHDIDLSLIPVEENDEVKAIFVSKHWIYVNDTYIPRGLIHGISAANQANMNVYLNTKNGCDVRIASIRRKYIKKYLRVLNHYIPEISVDAQEAFDNYAKNENDALAKQFKQDVTTKEQFFEVAGLSDLR